MKTSENKNLNAKPTETENGNTMLPPTPGLAHSRDTTEHMSLTEVIKNYSKLYSFS